MGLVAAIGLALARARHRPGRGLLVALAVALVVAVEIATAGVSRIAGDEALRGGLGDVAPGYRTIAVSASGFLSQPAALATRGALVTRMLAPVSDGPPRALTLFQPLADTAGGTYTLAAVDDLRTAVTIESGRLPAPCDPHRCEVVQVGSEPAPRLDPALGVVVVGRARISDPRVLSGPYQPTDHAPILLGDGAAAMDALASLPTFGRANGWVAPVRRSALTIAGVSSELAQLAALRSTLALVDRDLTLVGPDEQLAAAAARSDAAARRLLVVGAGAVALAIAFALLAAIGLGRDHQSAGALLARRGAGVVAIGTFHLVEAAAPAILGALVGLLGGGLAVAAIAAHERSGAGYASRGVLDALPTVGVTVVAVVAVLVLVLARLASERVPRRVPLVAVGLAVVAITVLAAQRGAVAPSRLAATDDPVLALLPVLAAASAAILAALVGPAALALIERVLGERALVVRLALLAAVRRPLRLVAVAGFVAAAVALGLFAVVYAATLRDGARDEAAFRVPFDATVGIGPALVRPFELATADGYAHLAPGLTVFGVLRQGATVRSSGHQATPVALVGLPPAALASMPGFRSDFAALAPAELARRITWRGGGYRGLELPPGTTRISFDLAGDFGAFEASVDVRDRDGTVRTLALDPFASVAIAPTGAGALVAGITFRVPNHQVALRLHQAGEGNAPAPAKEGTLRIVAVRANGAPVAGLDGSWTAVSGGSIAPSASGVAVRWVLVADVVRLRPVQPTDQGIPVIVDPATAAAAGPHGALAVETGAGRVLRAFVVATADRVPGLPERFVVADVAALSPALDADEPVTGSVRELWLRGPVERALADPRFGVLDISYRRRIEASLASDPLARAAVALVTIAGVLSLALAVVALILGLLGDARDERAELYALEADGLTARAIRRTFVVRAVVGVAIAAPVGVAAGMLVARSTAQLIAVTATATVPEPPLIVVVAWWQPLALVVVALVASSVVAGVAAAPLLRGHLPRRPEGGLS